MNTKIEKMKQTKRMYQAAMASLVFALCLTSCQKETETTGEDQESVINQETDFTTKYFLGTEVKVRLEDDDTYSLAGSDVRLFEDQLTDTADDFNENPNPEEGLTRLGLGGGVRKWTNSTVVYTTQGLSASVQSELQKSFDEWTSKTNIRFKERTNETNYVTISSSGSNSNSGVATLGMNGASGFIRLGTRATAVVIIHEIGHTLGYIHEQNRSDRDNYIIINTQNIQEDAIDQFYKSNSATLVTSEFDINSTMMYGSYTFSKNGQPTITDLNGNVLSQRQAKVSDLDISGTNSIYPAVDGGGTDVPVVDSCDGVSAWSGSKRYAVGDRVTYAGSLYERDFTRWTFIKSCN